MRSIFSSSGALGSGRRLWLLCLVVVLVVVLRGANLIRELRNNAIEGLEQDTQRLAAVLAEQTTRSLQLIDQALARIQAAARAQPADDALALRAGFGGENRLLLPLARPILILDRDGAPIAPSRPGPAARSEVPGQEWFRSASADFQTGPRIGVTGDRGVIVLSRRLESADGAYAGQAAAELDLDGLRSFYDSLHLGPGRKIALLRDDGVALFRYPDAAPPDASWGLSLLGWGTGPAVTTRRLADIPLSLNVTLLETTALQPLMGFVRLVAWQTVFAIAGVVLMFYVIARQFRRQRAQHVLTTDAEAALRDSEQRLRAYAEMASDWFWEMDANFRFSWTSPTSPMNRLGNQRADGLTRWELVGANPADPVWAAHIADLHAHRPFRDFRYERPGLGAEIRHVSISGTPVFTPAGQFTGYRGTGRDVTAEVSAARALRQALDRAEAASQAKSEFLANMSHELRTPLNVIIGFAELIVAQSFGKVEDRYVDFARDILGSGRHLLDLINDLLDMSKIEAGQFELTEEPVDLTQLIRSCVTMMQPRAAEGGVTLVLAPDIGPTRLLGDRRALRQVLLNLVSNAVKFTPTGGTVTLGVEPADQNGLALLVRDTGIGIAAEALEKLGEPFQQADASISRRFGGTGLGLAITRKLLGLHGGELRFDSMPDRGTTVRAVFPAERVIRAGAPS